METSDNEIFSSGNFIKDDTNIDSIIDTNTRFLKRHKLTRRINYHFSIGHQNYTKIFTHIVLLRLEGIVSHNHCPLKLVIALKPFSMLSVVTLSIIGNQLMSTNVL